MSRNGLPGYVFSPEEVWCGLVVPDKSTRVCKGLLDDWSSWIRERGDNAARMSSVVGALTVEGEPLEVGPILRLSVEDAQDVPSIRADINPADLRDRGDIHSELCRVLAGQDPFWPRWVVWAEQQAEQHG